MNDRRSGLERRSVNAAPYDGEERRFGRERRDLSAAQADVLMQLAIGLSYKEIAYRRGITYTTAWRHAHAARDALGAETVLQAVVWFVLLAGN